MKAIVHPREQPGTVFDAARHAWVTVAAGPTMTVYPPKQTRPVGFVIPDKPKPLTRHAGGWAKR